MANKKGEILKGLGNILLAVVPIVISVKNSGKQGEKLADEIIKFSEKIKS